MVSKIVLTAVVVVSLTAFSEGLKCYKCDGKVDSDCAKGELSAMVVDTCSEFQNLCASTDTTGAWTGRSFWRGCEQNNCDSLKGLQDIGVGQCKNCNEDLCNTDNLSNTYS